MSNRNDLPFPDLQQKLEELPTRRYIDVLRNRVNDLNRKLRTQPYLDQYPGKTQPFIFSKLYGPIGLQTPRRTENPGFESLAPLVSPSTPVLPRNQNILTSRIGAFYWCSTQVTGYLSWTYVSTPGAPIINPPIIPQEPSDIFDPVFPNNGGACLFNNFSTMGLEQSGTIVPILGFELGLYDKKRGRYIGDGVMPSEMFASGTFGDRKLPEPIRFEVDTELEPRVYVTEVRMGDFLDTDQAYEAARVQCFLSIAFKGYYSVDETAEADDRWFQTVPNS
jgi:hypothetical protein